MLLLNSRMPFVGLVVLLLTASAAQGDVDKWKKDWPITDFSRHSVELAEIISGGIKRDVIPAIDLPTIGGLEKVREIHDEREPVITLTVNGVTRAYPLTVLMWHEIVNDTLGGVPIAVTFCPLCNTAIVFDRRLGDEVLDFGTTGNLRFSDLVMYDRQTESWWQQFTGEGIVGKHTGETLTIIPSRVEPFAVFADRFPNAGILQRPPLFARNYGVNPYAGYDTADEPFIPGVPKVEGIAPLAYVVAVGNDAWSLDLLRKEKRVETDDLIITWEPGQLSVLDVSYIKESRDIGYVTVQHRTPGGLEDTIYDMTFAFAFNAFNPDGTLHQ
jgi:hypothetical protein